ncbi:MAG: DMT family transporter [Anaerolineales bacterium]
MRKTAIKTFTETSFYNVMMFSGFWAVQIFVTKLGFNSGAQVLTFQTLSILTALLILAIIILPKYGVEFGNLFRHQKPLYWKLFFANGIQSVLGTCLSIIGISLTEAINAGFLVKLATVTTILFAWLILKERLSPLKILTVITMLSGAYLLTTRGQILLPRVGDLFILSACVCWSLGDVLVRKYLKAQSVRADIVTLQKPIAGLPVILVLVGISVWHPVIFGKLGLIIACCKAPLSSLPYAFGNGLCLAITWIYLNRTLEVSSASYMTMMSMVTPVIVSLLAIFFLNETVIWIQIVGAGMIILSGVVIYFSDISHE